MWKGRFQPWTWMLQPDWLVLAVGPQTLRGKRWRGGVDLTLLSSSLKAVEGRGSYIACSLLVTSSPHIIGLLSPPNTHLYYNSVFRTNRFSHTVHCCILHTIPAWHATMLQDQLRRTWSVTVTTHTHALTHADAGRFHHIMSHGLCLTHCLMHTDTHT